MIDGRFCETKDDDRLGPSLPEDHLSWGHAPQQVHQRPATDGEGGISVEVEGREGHITRQMPYSEPIRRLLTALADFQVSRSKPYD